MSFHSTSMVLLFVLTELLCALRSLAADGPITLPHAHAHNDYEHTRPLLDALDHGFCSVEADVWLVDGKLLVAHDVRDIKAERTLEALYLDPLRARVDKQGGSVYDKGPGDRGAFWLLIDLKSEAEATYRVLHDALARHAEMLTTFRDGVVEKRAITVVVSGVVRPQETMARQKLRYAGIDGRLSDLDSRMPGHLMPVISDRWTAHFSWDGRGAMPDAERKRLREIVGTAHERGRVVRFWATPELPAVWRELRQAEVDLIGTDRLNELREFFTSEHDEAESEG